MKNKRELARDLYLVYEGDPRGRPVDHFTAQLFRLIQKADPVNRARLACGFPDEVSIWQEWNDTPTAEQFYEKYHVEPYVKRVVLRASIRMEDIAAKARVKREMDERRKKYVR